MDIFRLLQWMWRVRFHILGFMHALMTLTCVQYALHVWNNGMVWFDFNFWLWMYSFIATILITIQFDDGK